MAFFRCEYLSEALGMHTSFCAVLPEEGNLKELPVVYLLHGLSDNCTVWTRQTQAEWYARKKRAVLIMPEVQRSFYTDMRAGPAYFTYVAKELPAFCQRTFGLSAAREKNFVMGNSMGGYGALKCALTFPEQYGGCAAFSAVTDVNELIFHPQSEALIGPAEAAAIFGPVDRVVPEEDLFCLFRAAVQRDMPLPDLYLACGEQDPLWPMNLNMHRTLEELGVPHTFYACPGAHTWTLWDEFLRRAFDLFLGEDQLYQEVFK